MQMAEEANFEADLVACCFSILPMYLDKSDGFHPAAVFMLSSVGRAKMSATG